MDNLDIALHELLALANSDERRVPPAEAAAILGVHHRTLEEWRRSWRLAKQEDKSELRRGPPFIKSGRRCLYQVSHLKEWMAANAGNADGLPPRAAAAYLGVSIRALEDWRHRWPLAEQSGDPLLRRGPAFHKVGNHVWYERSDLDKFLKTRMPKKAPAL